MPPPLSQNIEWHVHRVVPDATTRDIKSEAETWQLYLQPMMDPPIADADVFDETKWPPLANILIAKLVIYEYLLNVSKSAIIAATPPPSSGGSTTTTPAGMVKYLETGPTRMELFSPSEYLANLFKNNGLEYGGVLGSIISDICLYTQRVGVTLPMCKAMQVRRVLPIKGFILPRPQHLF